MAPARAYQGASTAGPFFQMQHQEQNSHCGCRRVGTAATNLGAGQGAFPRDHDAARTFEHPTRTEQLCQRHHVTENTQQEGTKRDRDPTLNAEDEDREVDGAAVVAKAAAAIRIVSALDRPRASRDGGGSRRGAGRRSGEMTRPRRPANRVGGGRAGRGRVDGA